MSTTTIGTFVDEPNYSWANEPQHVWIAHGSNVNSITGCREGDLFHVRDDYDRGMVFPVAGSSHERTGRYSYYLSEHEARSWEDGYPGKSASVLRREDILAYCEAHQTSSPARIADGWIAVDIASLPYEQLGTNDSYRGCIYRVAEPSTGAMYRLSGNRREDSVEPVSFDPDVHFLIATSRLPELAAFVQARQRASEPLETGEVREHKPGLIVVGTLVDVEQGSPVTEVDYVDGVRRVTTSTPVVREPAARVFALKRFVEGTAMGAAQRNGQERTLRRMIHENEDITTRDGSVINWRTNVQRVEHEGEEYIDLQSVIDFAQAGRHHFNWCSVADDVVRRVRQGMTIDRYKAVVWWESQNGYSDIGTNYLRHAFEVDSFSTEGAHQEARALLKALLIDEYKIDPDVVENGTFAEYDTRRIAS